MNRAIESLIPQWLQQALVIKSPTQVIFKNGSTLLVDAGTGLYETRDVDVSVFSDDDSGVQTLPMAAGGPALGDGAQSLQGLLWSVRLARMQERLKTMPYEHRASMLKLNVWPALAHLPGEVTPLVARICALLSFRHSASANLMPTLLNAAPEQVFAVIEILRLDGCIQLVGVPAERAAHATPAPEGGNLTLDSFVTKIWKRLLAGPVEKPKPLPNRIRT